MRMTRLAPVLLAVLATASLAVAKPKAPKAEAAPLPERRAVATADARALSGPVHVADYAGAIMPVTTEFLAVALREAKEAEAQLFVLHLDTPGGLLDATRDIVQLFLNAPLPTAVLVGPQGARAASAGTFITMAAQIAAMSPGTNIGAASPVSGGGEEMGETMQRKVMNDTVAFIKSIAEKRGRNVEWAIAAVEKGESVSAEKALEIEVIDVVANDPRDLMDKLDGRELRLGEETVRLQTKGATVVQVTMNLRQRILSALSNPNLAYMLMMLGFYGIFFEIMNPGTIFPGVFGAVCLVIGLYALQTLPVNYAGLLLILLGVVFFILEIKVTSYGMLTVGGIASMLIGSVMLFESPKPYLRASWSVILTFVGASAVFFVGLAALGLKAQLRKVAVGPQGMIGELARATSDLSPKGTVFLQGESWSARAAGEVPKGATVRVLEVRGMELIVEPAEEPAVAPKKI